MANTTALLQSFPLWNRASKLPARAETSLHLLLYVPELKSLFNKGLNRGSLTELSGPRSTGKTSICLHLLARATQNDEICAIVDTTGSFHPESAAKAGVRLDKLLWIRCQQNAEHAMKASDLLLHAGGFGVIWLDLCEVAPKVLNRIPISYWHRYRRILENTSTVFLLTTDTPQAKSSFINRLEVSSATLCSHRATRFRKWRALKTSVEARTTGNLSRMQGIQIEF